MSFQRLIAAFFLSLVLMLSSVHLSHAVPKKVAAQKDKITVDALVKDENVRVLFIGKNNDFTYKFSDKKIEISFKERAVLSDTSKLSKAKDIITNIKAKGNKLTFEISSESVEVSKFKLKDKFGIDIKQKKAEKEKVEDASSTEQEKVEEPIQEKKAETQSKKNELLVSATKDDKHSTISFAWPKYVAAASYIRGTKLWVIFNDKATTSFSGKLSDDKWFDDVKLEDTTLGTVFSVDLKSIEDKHNVIMYRDGYNWHLEFSTTSIKPKDVRVVSRPLAAPQPRVEIELEEIALEAIRFTDSYVGDSVVAIPFADGGVAVKDKHSFVDFTIAQTIQGAVILPNADSLKIKSDGLLVKIEGAAGLNIAPRVLKKRESKFEASEDSFKMDEFIDDYLSILSIKTFQVKEDKFQETIAGIKAALSKAKTPEKRAKILANWALFYLANGLYKEGLSIVKILKKEDPEFGKSYNIKLVESVLNYMDYNYIAAHDIAKKISVVEIPISLRKEVRFWQAITGYMVSGSDAFLNRIDPMSIISERSANFLSDYNDQFMFEIIMSVIHDKISDKQYSDVASLLKILNELTISQHDKNRVSAVTAEYYASLDKPDDAIAAWDKCIEDIADLKNRTKCRFDKANYQDQTKRITFDEYILELENISYIWHGDQFEIDVLSKLGEQYAEKKDYLNSLKSWDKIVRYYPYSPDSLRLSRKMSDTFVNFFLEGKDTEMSHLKALAMFYEFERLVPIGNVGDDVITKFTDHLIALDLLDRASALLNHQIKNRLNGSKKEEAINKLAQIYLANEEPVYAVDIINQGESYTTLPDYIAKPRKYIHSIALHQNGQNAEALKLLKGDYSVHADEIKSEIYWDMREWKQFNDYIEPRIYKIRDNESILTSDEAESVLKLSISYLISGDWDLLGALYKDFKTRMPAEDKNTKIFLTLENSWDSIKQKKLQPEKSIALIQETVAGLVKALSEKKTDVLTK